MFVPSRLRTAEFCIYTEDDESRDKSHSSSKVRCRHALSSPPIPTPSFGMRKAKRWAATGKGNIRANVSQISPPMDDEHRCPGRWPIARRRGAARSLLVLASLHPKHPGMRRRQPHDKVIRSYPKMDSSAHLHRNSYCGKSGRGARCLNAKSQLTKTDLDKMAFWMNDTEHSVSTYAIITTQLDGTGGGAASRNRMVPKIKHAHHRHTPARVSRHTHSYRG